MYLINQRSVNQPAFSQYVNVCYVTVSTFSFLLKTVAIIEWLLSLANIISMLTQSTTRQNGLLLTLIAVNLLDNHHTLGWLEVYTS